MQCRDVELELALRLGKDPALHYEWPDVSAHVRTCPDCRKHFSRLKMSMAALDESLQEPTFEVENGLWKGINTALQHPQPRRLQPKTKYTFSVASVAVALLMMVSFLVPISVQPHTGEQALVREISSPFKLLKLWIWKHDDTKP